LQQIGRQVDAVLTPGGIRITSFTRRQKETADWKIADAAMVKSRLIAQPSTGAQTRKFAWFEGPRWA
jgi:hypothetical protein